MRKGLCWLFVGWCIIRPTICPLALGADRPVVSQSVSTTKAAADAVEIREFEVRVDDRPAGIHRLSIKTDGVKQTVGLQTDIKMDFIVYAYVFKFRGTEVWRDGRVVATDLRTEDGSKKRSFTLKAEGPIHQIAFNGKQVGEVSPCTMTTAYWRLPAADLRAKRFPIMDVDTAKMHEATLTTVGTGTVNFGGRSINCRHFKIDGSSPAELWFDDQDLLVRQRSVEQGHPTELRLKQIHIAKDDR